MKENTNNAKADAGRIGGLAKVAKGFAINTAAHVKAIRASARTRKASAAKRRKLAALLAIGGTVSGKRRMIRFDKDALRKCGARTT